MLHVPPHVGKTLCRLTHALTHTFGHVSHHQIAKLALRNIIFHDNISFTLAALLASHISPHVACSSMMQAHEPLTLCRLKWHQET